MRKISSQVVEQFCSEIENIREKAFNSLSTDDFKHLKKIEFRGRCSTIIGFATAWLGINPVSAFLISFGIFSRWLIAHHVMHKGYDKVPGIPKRYTSKYFARGKRRIIDWFDWIHPTAWDYEHNYLHHYHTGEHTDPDLVERHLKFLRELKVPYFLKYIFVFLASCTWKFTYYAPNTISVIEPETDRRIKSENIFYINFLNLFDLRNSKVRRLWLSCFLPYISINYILLPLLFLPLGIQAFWAVLINRLIAEAMTNFHSFMVIGPNHTAADLYMFDFHFDNKAEFYVTQVLASANYNTGNDLIDHLQIWLNYQIEHHLYPDLPMLKYQQIQPEVKSVCLKYGIDYRQESIFKRYQKMLAVAVGKDDMPKFMNFEQIVVPAT